MKKITLLTLCLGLFLSLTSTNVFAEDDKPTLKEWHYLQQIHLIGKIVEQSYKAIEKDGQTNKEMAEYSEEIIAYSIRKMNKWKVPTKDLKKLHEQWIICLKLSKMFFNEVSKGRLEVAEDVAREYKEEAKKLEAVWKKLEPRYKDK